MFYTILNAYVVEPQTHIEKVELTTDVVDYMLDEDEDRGRLEGLVDDDGEV